MKNIHSLLLILLSLVFFVPSNAREYVGANKSVKQVKATAAGCAQATSYRFLDVNNVRARINTGGDMWWDLPGGVGSQYFIPKEGTATSMYSGSLWIGGLDVNGQLKLAALRYRQVGNDYWTGPLTVDGTAAIDNATCAEYDKHFKVTRNEVDLFLAWWDSDNKDEDYPNYQIPESFYSWPAHGDVSLNQSYYLAPFKDVDGDGDYDPESGDYPYYDIENILCPNNYAGDPNYVPEPTPETDLGIVEGGILVDQILKGDQTLWWVFNDKGDFHSETQGASIGLEIRGQAFAFTTNDEINNMTFYSYEIINRSTFTLTETYFSPWVDTDLGFAWDDYVGCDVGRGLGYCYNGRAVDGANEPESYGSQPPAIGVDFFQGPYMDPDGMDNPKYRVVIENGQEVLEQMVDESINGVNFGNGIVDDERYGMRRFVYHNNTGPQYSTDPQVAPEYYNFLRGIWKDNTKMLYGGNAHISSGAVGPETDFMFPGDSDPWNWSTGGLPPNGGYNTDGRYWTEEEADNQYGDRRFMQSAGPFTLRPGAVNYITVGIPWARAASGGPFASVELLRTVDDKCQALFDNCFKVIDGPNAPDLTFTELDQEVIFYISNRQTSNNYGESYDEIDPNIPEPDSVTYDRSYTFEGYQIYQLKDASVSVESLDDPDYARLVAQFDIKNGIGRLINYEQDRSLDASVPKLKVDGADNGIQHSFIITEDAFAEGAKQLVNHKQYYFLALAYAHNNYLTYSQEPGILNGLYGQKLPYLAGRKNIKTYTVIPHRPVNGAQLQSEFGDQPQITRIEGRGNGDLELELTDETIAEILAKPIADSNNLIGSEDYPMVYEPVYKPGYGPIDVRVIDPLNVKSGQFELAFDSMVRGMNYDVSGDLAIINGGDTASMLVAGWKLKDLSNDKVYSSEKSILTRNEQIFPELGFAVNLEQIYYPGPYTVGERPNGSDPNLKVYKVLADNNGLISSSITLADSSIQWYQGLPDQDIPGTSFNWIRSGTSVAGDVGNADDDDMDGNNPWDPNSNYEGVVEGTWAPYSLCAAGDQDPNGPAFNKTSRTNNKLYNIASIDFVITSDRTKWTRCPVVEMCDDNSLSEGGANRFELRKSPSIDKDGNFATNDTVASDNPEDPNYINGRGMGWFPGYAINVETGERLNIIYGEDSWLSAYNGRDMQWNPTSARFNPTDLTYLFGGKHYIYVMSPRHIEGTTQVREMYFPAYDAGQSYVDALTYAETAPIPFLALQTIYSSAMWVTIPLANPQQHLATDVEVKIRVAKPYNRHFTSLPIPDSVVSNYGNKNNNYPMYNFSTESVATQYGSETAFDDDLDMIRVVPNPYYAYSTYESVPLDNRVKITNLPDKCTVTIYTLSGTEVRQFDKDNSLTSIEWDLKNFAGVPVAGGIYLIHIETELNGAKKERVLKWFGMMRKQDLNTF